MAEKQSGITGDNFLRILERRLDNVVYRLGFAASRKEGRQLVRHGHFTLNGHKANIPSMLVRPGDIISIKEKSKKSSKIKELREKSETVPQWLEADIEKLEGKVVAMPVREDIELPIEEHLIVELYSR